MSIFRSRVAWFGNWIDAEVNSAAGNLGEKWGTVKGDVHMLATLGAIKALFPAPFTGRLAQQ